jgi:hypothetical protein
MGVRYSGCDTRGNTVMLVLPSTCILLTFIGHNRWQGVWDVAWHGAYGRSGSGMKSICILLRCFAWVGAL